MLEQLKREVLVYPPKEAENKGSWWRLKKCLYGLKDAPRMWWKKLDGKILQLGCVRSRYDKALYVWRSKDGQLWGIAAFHVDDIVYAGMRDFKQIVIRGLVKHLLWERLRPICFTTQDG